MQISSAKANVVATFAITDAQTARRAPHPPTPPTAVAVLVSLDQQRTAEYQQWQRPQQISAAGSPRTGAASGDDLECYEVVYVDTAGPRPRADGRAVIGVDGPLTMVCEFDVAAGRQHDLLQLLRRDHEGYLRDVPGFVSVSFHRGLRFGRVLEYLQFQSAEQFQAVSDTEQGQRHIAAMNELAVLDFELYRVESVSPLPSAGAFANTTARSSGQSVDVGGC